MHLERNYPGRACTTDATLTAREVETERLILRRITEGEAPFLLELLNDPSFLRFIGDRGVRTLDDARSYVRTGPATSYARHGFGLWLTELKSDGTPIGICGLLKRDALDDVDVGFAFLPAFRACGYAIEATAAVLSHARSTYGLARVVAVVHPENASSRKLLAKAGMVFQRVVQLSPDEPPLELFGEPR